MRLRAAARLAVAAVVLSSAYVVSPAAAVTPPEPDTMSVLFYGPNSGGLAATTPGITATVWDRATWASKTTADFQRFDAIVFGDQPVCGFDETIWDTAIATRDVWSPAVTGNVIINGTDPDFHSKTLLVHQSVDFATEAIGTGLYVSLSCAYENVTPRWSELLLGLGTFGVVYGGCPNDAHKVASHASLAGIDDAYLSNWGCSAHTGFTSWPGEYVPLAIVRDAANMPSPVPTFSDGSRGMAYILAKGVTSFPLFLTPPTAKAPKGSQHEVTATLLDENLVAVPNTVVRMHVTAGPNVGHALECGTCRTSFFGTVTGTYIGTQGIGADTIEAYVDTNGNFVADPGEARTTAGMTWLRPVNYVSLGDSFSAGEGLRPYLTPSRCHRSYDAYSRKVQGPSYAGTFQSYADSIQFGGEVTHDFIACSGAEIPNVNGGVRKHGEPAQLDQDKVLPGTDLVTLTVSGNDVGFAPLLGDCAIGNCLDFYYFQYGELGEGLVDWLPKKVDSMYEPLLGLYRDVKSLTPATVVTMSYPHLFPSTLAEQQCNALSYLFTPEEQNFLNLMTDRLAGVIQDAAADAGIHYVDVRGAFAGHAVCGSAGEWIHGLTKYKTGKGLGVGDASFHPKIAGQAAYASELNAYLQGLVDNGWATQDTGLPINPAPLLPLGPSLMAASVATTTTPLGSYGRVLVDPVSTTATCHEVDAFGTGQQIRVSADGFVPGSSVQLTLINEARVATTVGTFTANADGVVTTTMAIPASFAPDSIGELRATGTGLDGGVRGDLGQFYVDDQPAACATAPTVTSVSPSGGVTAGGTSVTITGTGFTSPATVKFGANAATNVVVNSPTSITATSPAGAAGQVYVTVTTAAGTSATGAGSTFWYGSVPTVSRLRPSSVGALQTVTLTITGTNFIPGMTKVSLVGGNAWTAGVTPATVTPTQITIDVTAGCKLTDTVVDITVGTPVGVSAKTSATKFTYKAGTSLQCTSGQ